MDKREIKKLKYGVYTLPTYTIDNGLVKTDNTVLVKFMETTRNEDGTISGKTEGLIIESVLELALQRMQELNEILPNRYNSIAINNIEQAIWALQEKERERINKGILNTTN